MLHFIKLPGVWNDLFAYLFHLLIPFDAQDVSVIEQGSGVCIGIAPGTGPGI